MVLAGLFYTFRRFLTPESANLPASREISTARCVIPEAVIPVPNQGFSCFRAPSSANQR
jgi:hypothetical protein